MSSGADPVAQSTVQGKSPGYTVYRITQPSPFNARLVPPFQQVLVQTAQPVPGQVYNVLFITMTNTTLRTFTASDGLAVKLTSQTNSVPILTGNQEWKPGQTIVFYVLTKTYYPPIAHVLSGGFVFDLAGSRGIAIPGPSGIYQGIKYEPSNFSRILNTIVVDGPNHASGSRGHLKGLPTTNIWAFKLSKTLGGPRRTG